MDIVFIPVKSTPRYIMSTEYFNYTWYKETRTVMVYPKIDQVNGKVLTRTALRLSYSNERTAFKKAVEHALRFQSEVL